jgi:RNA recognition motif-containing protein
LTPCVAFSECACSYVGNLSWDTRANDLSELFSKYGAVEDSFVATGERLCLWVPQASRHRSALGLLLCSTAACLEHSHCTAGSLARVCYALCRPHPACSPVVVRPP